MEVRLSIHAHGTVEAQQAEASRWYQTARQGTGTVINKAPYMYLTLILALRLITDVISTEYLAPAFFHKLLL